jgi:hypothetical protein
MMPCKQEHSLFPFGFTAITSYTSTWILAWKQFVDLQLKNGGGAKYWNIVQRIQHREENTKLSLNFSWRWVYNIRSCGLSPCISERARRFGRTYSCHLQVEGYRGSRGGQALSALLVSYWTYYSTLKVEVVCSSETSGSLQSIWLCNTKDGTIKKLYRSPK